MAKLRALGKRAQRQYADSTVRRCSAECFFFKNGGNGCQYYERGEVRFGDVCMNDLVKVKAYADAFIAGDIGVVKDDASRITALVMQQVENMLQQVSIEGATIEEPMTDAKGAVVYIPDPDWDKEKSEKPDYIPAMRMREHPLISRAIQLAKSMGVSLGEFKLTPKSADEKPQVAGHIVVEKQVDMKVILEQRLITEERYLRAIEEGNEMTKKDPVFQQLLEQGDIIGGK
jgi:hypothetical protein